MKCIIGGPSLGVWCRIIHNLAQVGDAEIFFDFAETIMTISTTNSSMSSFATFILFRPFFQCYSMTSEEPEKVAIPAKIMLKPFRSQKMAKNHVCSEILYNTDDDHITIMSEGKSHATSTYNLGASNNFSDIQLDCDPYTYRNSLKVEAKILSAWLSNFSHVKGLSDLTIKIQGQKITLRNTVTDVTRKDGNVATEFSLTAHDFIDFEVQDDNIEFAFGFREFKHFTTFAEQLKLPIYIHFQTPQDPVIITVKMETFEARLCMATRLEDPFDTIISIPGTTGSSGTNGRISNVSTPTTSALSVQSASGAPQEVNRLRTNRSSNAVVATPSDINVTEPPPAKRVRRTEAAPPPAELSQSLLSVANDPFDNDLEMFDNVEEPEDPNRDVMLIGPLVEKMEQRNKSLPYKAIQRLLSRPRISNEDYLKTVPGHDVVLCPDSDEES